MLIDDASLLAAAAVLAAVLLVWLHRIRQRAAAQRQRRRDALDTVAAWPPEATRVLTAPERLAHRMLVTALPDHLVLAQVPLVRFLRVPRRHSYAQWLARVGQLSADLLVCDPSSQVLAAVVLRAPNSSERSQRRRERMARVLAAAGVKMVVWPEDKLPSASAAREQLLPASEPVQAPARAAAPPAPSTATLREELPLPEVVEESDEDHRHEPPPSTWFDDLDPAPAGGGWQTFGRS